MAKAMSTVPNCKKATSAEPPATKAEPMYGARLSTPATTAHTAAFSSPSAQNATPVTTPTSTLVNTCTSR